MLSTMSSRSTKGASKQRRENINSEISIIRDLLPIQEQVRSRLSQLQIMSLCKAYIGKSNLLNSMQDLMAEEIHPFDFTQAIPGFIIITDLKGRIFYVSDNVTDYLAHSMVDVVTQAETIYELVHNMDQQVFRTIYSFGDQSSLAEDSTLAFTCRMGMLRHPRRNPNFDRYKKMRIFGRKIVANELSKRAYFVALCTPRLNPMMASDPSFVFDTMIFKSVHAMDMKFVCIDHNGEYHLGYSKEDLFARSWYEMIHPEDIELAVNKHKELIQQVGLEATCSLCLRVQSKSGEMLCLQLIMKKESNVELGPSEAQIVCWNQVICPNEMGMDDKEELLHQMSTINYLEQYCSSQSSDKKVFYSASGGIGVAKEKKCDRSELMEKLKRKMQKPETEKTIKMAKLENPSENTCLKDGGLKNPSPLDPRGILSEKNQLTPFNGQNGGIFYDLSIIGLNNGSPMNTNNQLLQSNPVTIDSSMKVFNQANETSSNLNCFSYTDFVTMPTPERQQTWSPSPGSNYLATSPTNDDLNNQSFFPVTMGIHGEGQLFLDEKRFVIPELNPNEVDEFFEMQASANFLAGAKDESLSQSSVVFDQLEGCTMFSEQFTHSLLQQLSAMAY